MKDVAKEFFSSKAGKVGTWIFMWIFEYNLLSWCVDKIPNYIVKGAAGIGYVLIIYAIYYWLIQKSSTEVYIYSLLIFEFVFHNLNEESIFNELFKFPLEMIYIVLPAYFFIRIFVMKKIYRLLNDICIGFAESKREQMKQKAEEIKSTQDTFAKEKAEKAEYIRNRSLVRRRFWRNFRDNVVDFVFSILDFFVAIPLGLIEKNRERTKRKKKTKTIITKQKNEKETEEKEMVSSEIIEQTPKWVYLVIMIIAAIVISLFCLLLYYQFYISQSEISQIVEMDILTSFLRNLSNNSSSIEWVAKIISLCIIDVALLIVLLIIAFIIFIIVIQIVKSGNRMVKDLIKSINNPSETDYSSTVFYSIIVFVICFFAYKLYPFDANDFAELLSNGSFVIYPIVAAVFIPIITAVIDVFKSDTITNYLKSDKAGKVKEKFSNLALGTLEAMLNYITFVTKDFLQSIQELSIEEFDESHRKPDNTRGENNNDDNDKNGNHTNSIDSRDCSDSRSGKVIR